MAGILPPVFLIFSLGASVVYSGSHTLHYHVTIVSAPTPGVPRYLVSMYVDGVQYGRYNSDIRHAEALYPSLGALSEHIEKQTQYAQGYEMRQRRKLKFLNGYLNKTRGNGNIYQRRLACELYEDGTIGGYEEIAFDGQELLVYDKERVVYVPVTHEAEMLSFIWNICYGPTDTKLYMENDCIEHIKLYLPYISTDLERKVPPNVNISSSESESGTKLHCRVYGFYPRDVEVKWIKNGRDEIHSEEAAQILPNPDGTYQIRVSVGVTLDKNSNYSCLVDHSSLETPIIVTFEPKNGSCLYIIISVSVTLLLLLLIILGVLIYRKRMMRDSHGSHEPVSISGESLNTDAHPKAQEEQITHSSPEGLENSDEILRKVEKRHYPFYIKQVLKPQ
ncbi:major histocompatibility complex class I-related gene protein-like [Xenopus tropicalis]|uniref:Major histocompatibility complex class I-related gene protein-like n=1 Tax=Xenopus tropicalis TaxID=8364 RepID=A0A8J1IMD1_XENTR|nr:major histocompatibility complex class I-related gene protein-like [Xenopus tropicalis]